MDLGNKKLNNLISKDFKLQMAVSSEIINSKDVEVFELLNLKAEFIFDFIKDKINRNFFNSVNPDNVFNLFDFLKVYSFDFKEFILNSFSKFQNEEIISKMFDILKEGTEEEKTYAVEFFTSVHNNDAIDYVKNFVKSEFEPLKIASAKFLAKYSIKEEFLNSISILKNSDDEIEKFEAVEFLVNYGDKEGFKPIYEYFIKSGLNEIVAQNILFLKSFNDLINEGLEDEILNIYSTLLRALPENVSFSEINYYLKEGVFDFLIESDKNFSLLLNFYLKNKIDLILNNDAYLIDLDKEDKKDITLLKEKLSFVLEGASEIEAVKLSLQSDNLIENMVALEIANETEYDFSGDVIELFKKTKASEIILYSLNYLKSKGALQNQLVKIAEEKTQNETIKAEIQNYYC